MRHTHAQHRFICESIFPFRVLSLHLFPLSHFLHCFCCLRAKRRGTKRGRGEKAPLTEQKTLFPLSVCLLSLPLTPIPIPLPFPHYLHTAVARPVAQSKPYFIPNRPPDRASSPTIHHSPTDPAPDLVKPRVMDIGPLPHHPPTRPGHSLGSFDQTESRRVRIRSGAHSTANSLPIV